MVRSLAAVLAVHLFCACGGEELLAPEDAPDALGQQSTALAPRASSGYDLLVTDRDTRKVKDADTFALDALEDLHFMLEVPSGQPGRHTLTLFVYAPGGSAWARYDVRFSVGQKPAEGEILARRLGSSSYVQVSMPVAGTWIQQYRLTGGWRAEAWVDQGAVGPVERTFTLH